MIDPLTFYNNYYGHTINNLELIKNKLTGKPFIYLAGDSILDNKYWILNTEKKSPVNGYNKILSYQLQDVSYFMNKYNTAYTTINCAVEESALNEKNKSLNNQDKFIIDNVTSNDIIIISLGGNDIALRKDMNLIYLFGKLIISSSVSQIDDYSLNIPIFNEMLNIFIENIDNYISKLITKNIPKKIIACLLCYPCEKGSGWVDNILSLIGYNNNPQLIQSIIRRLTYMLKNELNSDLIEVVGLWECLNGKNIEDYVQRVEPSVIGGEKIAKFLISHISQ